MTVVLTLCCLDDQSCSHISLTFESIQLFPYSCVQAEVTYQFNVVVSILQCQILMMEYRWGGREGGREGVRVREGWEGRKVR